MTQYSCDTCKFYSSVKANYLRHINTDKHKHLTEINDMKSSTKSCIKSFAQPLVEHKSIGHKSGDDSNLYVCEHCNTTFSKKYNLKRHQSKNCKFNAVKNEQKKDKSMITIKDLETSLGIISGNEGNSSEKGRSNVLTSQSNNVNNNISNSHNVSNIHNDNRVTNINSNNVNSNNIVQQNVIVNNFGKDDWSHVTEGMYIDYLKHPQTMIPKAFQEVNLNKDVPQNHNIRVANKRSGKVLVWYDHMWNNRNKGESMLSVVDEKYYEIDSFFRNMMEKNPERLMQLMTKSEIKAYQEYSARFDKERDSMNVNDPTKQPINEKLVEDCFYKLVDILENMKDRGEFFKSLK